MAKLALALSPPGRRLRGPGQQAASKVVVKGDIGVDPGPITPGGFMFEDTEASPRRAVEIKHGRISMMAFLGMMVQELGITFPGSMTLDGSVSSRTSKDGRLRGAANVPTSASPRSSSSAASPRPSPCRRRSTRAAREPPGGYDDTAGTIPERLPVHGQITDPARARARSVRAPERPRRHDGHFGAMCHSMVDSCDHRLYPIAPQLLRRRL